MIDQNHQHFPPDKARTLMRRLRDLNLSTGPIAVREDLTASLAGCSSLDNPAESGVRYRVRVNDAAEVLMELLWTAAGLELALTGHRVTAQVGPGAKGTIGMTVGTGAARASSMLAQMCVPITCDRKGRACVPKLGARVSPDSTDKRQLEHFLRRAVRTLLHQQPR